MNPFTQMAVIIGSLIIILSCLTANHLMNQRVELSAERSQTELALLRTEVRVLKQQLGSCQSAKEVSK